MGRFSGVKRVSSISREGLSLVRLQFYWGINIDYALLEVRGKLDVVRRALPEGAGRPTIVKIDPSAESIITIALTYLREGVEERKIVVLKEFAESFVKRRLEQIEGVSQAVVAGGYNREVLVLVDVEKMRSFNLTIEDISSALRSSNLSLIGGTIKQGVFRYPFHIASEFQDLKDVENVVVQNSVGLRVRLSDIAKVVESFRG